MSVRESVSHAEVLKVVKSVVQEEDRSRNLMVFGIPEKNNENITERVRKYFSSLELSRQWR